MTSTMQVETLAVNEILFDEDFNCRGHITPMDVVDLAKSIKEHGLIQPVVVTMLTGARLNAHPDKKYLLIAGYRRYTAFRINKDSNIPAIIRTDMGDEADARLFNLSENLQRKELNIPQEAAALAKLYKLGLTETQIAERLGMSRGWVQVRVMVLKLPTVVQAEIAAGWLNQTQIRDVYSHYTNLGEDACYDVVKKFKDDKLKGRKNTRKKVSKKKDKNPSVKRERTRDDIFELQEHVYGQFRGNSIITRVLAWCAGEISSDELHTSIEDYADSHGLEYSAPE